MKNYKISLFLMTIKGYKVLSYLINNGYSSYIDKVIAAEDKVLENDYFTEIKTLCEEHKVTFFHRTQPYIIESDYQIAISWRWLISEANNLIVMHDSILPRYRGFAPLVSSLINGEKEIGVTALIASDEYDAGDIIDVRKTRINYPIKIRRAIELIIENYCELTESIFKSLTKTGIDFSSTPQDSRNVSYSLWLDEEDYRINWHKDSNFIKRFIDSTGYPYKGASTMANGKMIRIYDSEIVEDVEIENRTPGKVIFNAKYPTVVCGNGLLLIKEAKYEDGSDFLPLKNFRTRLV